MSKGKQLRISMKMVYGVGYLSHKIRSESSENV